MMVSAEYRGKMDEAREGRVHKVFERYGVRFGEPSPVLSKALGVRATVSDVEWTCNADGTWNRLKIHIDEEERERAVRLASELRACGMVVGVGSDDDCDWPEYDDE